MSFVSALVIVGGLFVAYTFLHYILFRLSTNPKDAAKIGHGLNEFERRQLVEWAPKSSDFLKHDDQHRTYDDVFGKYRNESDNYSTCVFPRAIFYILTNPTISCSIQKTECVCWILDVDRAPPQNILQAVRKWTLRVSPIQPYKGASANENLQSLAVVCG